MRLLLLVLLAALFASPTTAVGLRNGFTSQGSKVKIVLNGKTIVDADIAPFPVGQPTQRRMAAVTLVSPAPAAMRGSSATETRFISATSASRN